MSHPANDKIIDTLKDWRAEMEKEPEEMDDDSDVLPEEKGEL